MTRKQVSNFVLLVFSLLLSACFANVGSGIGADKENDIGPESLTLTNFQVTSKNYAGFDVSFDYIGDSNSNSDITFYFCSVRQLPGCDPLAGNQIKLSKVGTKITGSISLSAYSYSGADVIKYAVSSTDSDGLVGGTETGDLVIPMDTSKIRKITQLGFTHFGKGASLGDSIQAFQRDASGSIFIAGTTKSSLGEANAGEGDIFVAKLSANGVLDTSFSEDGIVQLGNTTLGVKASEQESVSSIIVDSNGSIFVAGDTAGSLGEANAGSEDVFVVKLTSEGLLDTSFSGDGIVQLGNVSIGAGASALEYVRGMKLDSAGNIIVAGYTDSSLGETNGGFSDIFVVRLTPSGALDTSFSGDGIVQLGNTTLGAATTGWEYTSTLELDASGNIYIGGMTNSAFGEVNAGIMDAFVVKLTSTGALDTSFSGDGIIQLGNVTVGASGSGFDYLTSLALDSGGNILVSGDTSGALGETNAGNYDIYLAKITPAGVLDTSFSGDGILQLGNLSIGAGASGKETIRELKLDSSGNIFLLGETWGAFGEANSGFSDPLVVKLTSAGVLDTSFSGDGIVQLGNLTIGANASSIDYTKSIDIDSSGSVLVAGYTGGSLGEQNAGDIDAFLFKLTSSGTLDTSFSGGGLLQLGSVTIGTGASVGDQVKAIKVDSAGNMYLAGETSGALGEANSGNLDAFVIKLNSSGALDTSFSGDGIVQLGSVTVGANASASEYLTAMNIDSSGNIYLAGDTSGSFGEANSGNRDAFVAKITSAGLLDTTFAGDGIFQLGNVSVGAAASANEYIANVHIDSSGYVYIAGATTGSLAETGGGSYDMYAAKITPGGILDTSFSGDGIAQLGNVTVGAGAGSFDTASAMTIDSSGNLYLAGFTQGAFGETNAGASDALVVKLTSTGVLDTSFSGDGILQLGNTTIGAAAASSDVFYAVEVDSSQNLYLAGFTQGSLGEANAGNNDIIAVKVTSTGVLDTSFSGDGILQLGNVSIGAGASGLETVNDITIDSSGNMYIAAETLGALGETNGGSRDAVAIKITSTGVLDTSFSGDGILHLGSTTIGVGSANADYAYGIDIDSSGNVYLGGYTEGSLGDVSGGTASAYVAVISSTGTFD